MNKNKPTEVEVIEGDPYAYYLSIWNTEESLQERNRTMFMTLQGVLLTVTLIYLDSNNKGLAIFFSFMGLMLFQEWFPEALLRVKKITFIKWLIIEHETTGRTTRNIFTSMQNLGKKCNFDKIDLIELDSFKKLIKETRIIEIRVAIGLSFLWFALIVFAIKPDAKYLNGFILSLFGIQT